MKVYKLREINKTKFEKIRKRSFGTSRAVSNTVKKILNDIQKSGEAIINGKYKARFENYSIRVTAQEIKQAYKEVTPDFLRAAKQAIKNITAVHKVQFDNMLEESVETEAGIYVWREWRPIEKVGLYIPGGKAIYPSSVLMTAIPAILAGSKNIVLCSPPNKKGSIPAPTLVAADMLNLKNIFKVGGAEAIAAMAFGTTTIPKVYKIFGAGNSYVTEAKMQVYGLVDIDMSAGPSEIFIIADESANPAFIAADLLADGEHGEDSACVLLTTSEKLAKEVRKQIRIQLKTLATGSRIQTALKNYGLLAVVDTMDEAIEFCNEYAPEHLEIMTKDADDLVKKITNAGSVFIGDWTTKSAGDYATGANHVLPTGGMAKMFNPLSVESFGKKIQVQKVDSQKALKRIKKTIETFGEVEELPAHKNATSIRFENI